MKGKRVKVLALIISAFMALTGFSACNFDGLFGELDSAIDSVLGGGSSDSSGGSSAGGSSGGDTPVQTGELSIHFPELGNRYTGDCTLIKTGNVEVLIDAGSRNGSAATLVPYIENYCTDGKLEYVVATHAHQDHIAALVGNSSAKGILESFEIGTLIDFPLTNATSNVYDNYVDLRDELMENGTLHYTALDCWNNVKGAKRSIKLADGITLNVLYQEFYEKKTGDENDYSVCLLLSQGENHYLFTGDLEADGEASLVRNNDLPKCKLFKGGHHGSPTSNTDALLKVIQPEIVCVCCCCGSTEYTTNMNNVFPSQAFVNRVGLYTSQIYVTTIISEDGKSGVSMNGNIVVSSTGGEVTVNCSNNNTIFKETEWFKKYRVWPANGK
ncbi:MAG: MBL fold metallo-hydrolase [Clostridia bacterium]|nr:MBL fold metallo-hydrolase [Clostridia bacterium]